MDHEASSRHGVLERMLLDESAEPIELPLSLLEDITDGFSDDRQIGKGRLGVVYKGMLDNRTVVAVNKLSNTYMQEKGIYLRVESLLKVKHRNILRFLGHCSDVQERFLCFEYLPKGSLDEHITRGSIHGLEWAKRYQIIKGISKSLHHLHQNHIVHPDLKPTNILLDDNMIPKISDYGFSRCYDEMQSQAITSKLNGSVGYFAPEFYNREITFKSDIYSLGLIIGEIIMGEKRPSNDQHALESWRNKWEGDTKFEQIRVCAEIGIECTEFNPAKRPVTQHIIDRLDETESTDWCPDKRIGAGVSSSLVTQASSLMAPVRDVPLLTLFSRARARLRFHFGCSKLVDEIPGERSYEVYEIQGVSVVPINNELLEVYPRELRFPFEPNKFIPFSLQLTNNTDYGVAFRLTGKSEKSLELYTGGPLRGLVPRRSTCTYVLAMRKLKKRPKQTDLDMILQSTYCSYPEIQRPGNDVTLKAVLASQGDITSELISPGIKILSTDRKCTGNDFFATDTTRQWIIKGYNRVTTPTRMYGQIYIWNYDTQRLVDSVRVLIDDRARVAGFIARKKWLVIESRGVLHVYNCGKKGKEMRRVDTTNEKVYSVTAHPTQPYLLAAGSACRVQLFNWEKGWSCKQTFNYEHTNAIVKIVFNPEDTNSFATASRDGTVKLWNLDFPESEYTLEGHWNYVCLHFYIRDGQQYLIIGSVCTAKIWDIQKKTCVGTLDALVSEISSVSSHPSIPIFLVGLQNGDIQLWSSTNFSLQRTLHIGSGSVTGFLCLMGSKRVVIGQTYGITMMEIDDVNCQEETTDSSEPELSTRLQDTTSSKVRFCWARLLMLCLCCYGTLMLFVTVIWPLDANYCI